MPVSSTDDIPTQLAKLLGKKTVRIRKTDETPPRISVIDTIAAVTGRDANRSGEAIRELGDRFPEVNGNIVNLKFPGRRQRNNLDVVGWMGRSTDCSHVGG